MIYEESFCLPSGHPIESDGCALKDKNNFMLMERTTICVD